MSTLPQLPDYRVTPIENPLDQLGKAMKLKQLMADNQMGQLQLQQAQQDQKDRDTVRALAQKNNGDPDKTLADAEKAGVSMEMLMTLRNQNTQTKTSLAKLHTDELSSYKQINSNILDAYQSVANAPPERQASVYAQRRQQALQSPEVFGITDASHVPPEEYPGIDWVNDQILAHQTADAHFNQDMKRREVAAQELRAQNAGNKPDTATENKQQFQGVIGKIVAESGNQLPKGTFTDPRLVAAAIQSSKTLTPEEKQFGLSYMAANPMPATQALNVTLRGAAYGEARPVQMLDTAHGNRPVTINMDDLNVANRLEPGRYISATGGTSALNKENLMEDIRGGVQQVRESLNNPNMPEFTAGQRAKIAVALRERDPRSAISSLVTSGALGAATPEQQDYLINQAILIENAMAMRTVLGAGQGSQDLRSAITATIPGPTTPSKAYASKQLDAFEKTLDRLERGIPNVPLRPMQPGGPNATSTPSPQRGGKNVAPEGTIVDVGNGQRQIKRNGRWVPYSGQ